MKRHSRETELADWFRWHFGVITRQEALRLGLTKAQIQDRVEIGLWIRVHPGVYRLAAMNPTPLTFLRAALGAAGDTGRISHLSAAWLHGMTDRSPRRPTVTVAHGRVMRLDDVDAVRSRHLPVSIQCKGLPCTSPMQTLMDCATVTTPEQLDALVDQALGRKVVKGPQLQRAADDPSFRHHRGRQPFVQRLAARGVTGSPNPSVLESRTARLMKSSGLPVPKAEVEWIPDRGERRYRLDFSYPHLRLVIEVDGWASHMTPEKQRYDNTRNNALNLDGSTVLHYDWWQITYDGERVAAEILQAYRRLAAA